MKIVAILVAVILIMFGVLFSCLAAYTWGSFTPAINPPYKTFLAIGVALVAAGGVVLWRWW